MQRSALQRLAAPLRACASGVQAAAGADAACCSGSGLGRAYSTHVEHVAPAVTYQDVADDWYMRQRSHIALGNRMPHIAVTAWVAPNAVLVGDVDLYNRASVWDGAVLRGDLNNITIGNSSNVQDRCVLHAARSSPTGLTAATLIGNYVTIEPNSVLRSARVQDYCVVGARSVLLEGSLMEPFSRLAPGSVLPPARRVPEGELWGGTPARFIRKLDEDDQAAAKELALQVRRLAYQLAANELPHGTAWREVEEWRKKIVEAGGAVQVRLRRLKYELRVAQEQEAKDRQL